MVDCRVVQPCQSSIFCYSDRYFLSRSVLCRRDLFSYIGRTIFFLFQKFQYTIITCYSSLLSLLFGVFTSRHSQLLKSLQWLAHEQSEQFKIITGKHNPLHKMRTNLPKRKLSNKKSNGKPRFWTPPSLSFFLTSKRKSSAPPSVITLLFYGTVFPYNLFFST